MTRIVSASSTFLLAAAAVVLFSLGTSETAFADTLFEETFNKDASGNLEFSRIIPGVAGPATIELINGTGDGFDGVKRGSVELNGVNVFGGFDFKVTGTISRAVALLDGSNALNITLGGPVGGTMTIRVTQGEDEPSIEFPPGTIFVSAAPFGDDHATCGTEQLAPCATITYGIGRCQGQLCPQVAVSSGIYTESVHLFPGISVLGGYNVGFTMRDIATWRPVIIGNPTTTATVTAANISNSTTFEGFIVFAPSTNDPSAESIGIKVVNSNAALLIQNNLIFGGVAGDGADREPGAAGVNGVDGGDGLPGLQLSIYDPDPGPRPGGPGGEQIIGATNVSGGNGGEGFYPMSFNIPCGSPGINGQGLNSGLGGRAGGCGEIEEIGEFSCTVRLPDLPFDGSDGGHGANGLDGVGGLGGVAGIGAATAGADGGDGEPGSGAGGGGPGGGAAPNAVSASCDDVFLGPTGGGGGSGADGGKRGLGGGGGGGSFGIFIESVGVPTIGSNEIYLGIGGDGGRGGRGGPGGIGAVGGQAGPSLGFGTGIAGNGGSGGNGGHGAGGGGGAGGLSVGIHANFDATGSYDVTNEIHVDTGRAGQGGRGGFSLAVSGQGQDGQDGVVLAVLYE